MKHIHKYLALVVVLGASMFLAGCEKKNNPETQLIAPGQQYTMQIWTYRDTAYMEALGQEFLAAANTPGLGINVVEFESKDEMKALLLDAMAEGIGPDVIYTTGDWIVQHSDKLVPRLRDVSFTPDLFRNTFVRVANETLIQDEKIYGVPMGVDTLAVIYNQEHIIDNLPERNTTAPTWQKFLEDTTRLTKKDNSVSRFLLSGAAIGRIDNTTYGTELLENILVQNGVEFFASEGSESRIANTGGTNAQGQRVNLGQDGLDLFTSFADPRYKNYSWNDLMATTEDKEYEAFMRGEVSQVFGYASDYKNIQAKIKSSGKGSKYIAEKNVRIGMLPQKEDPNISANRSIIGEVYALAVPRTSRQNDVAWRFLKFAVRQNNMKSYYQISHTATPRLDLLQEQEDSSDIGVYVRQAKFSQPHTMPLSRNRVHNDLGATLLLIQQDQKDSDKALEDLQDSWTHAVRRAVEMQEVLDVFDTP